MSEHPILAALRVHIVNNIAIYSENFLILVIATVNKMPKLIPKSLQDAWTWARDSLQTAIPAGRGGHQEEVQIQTPIASTVIKNESKEN